MAEPSNEGCPHPLMPLVEGARWEYELGNPRSNHRSRAVLTVTKIEHRGPRLHATVKRVVGPSRTTVEAECGDDGTSFLALFIPLGPPLPVEMGFAPRITKRTGVLLPPLTRLRAGAEWTYSLVAHTENPGGRALTMDSDWQVQARYRGEDTVTVPAGRYEVRKVELTVTAHHRPPAEEDVVFSEQVMDPPPMTFTYSLAPGVGVVQIDGVMRLSEDEERRSWWKLIRVAGGSAGATSTR